MHSFSPFHSVHRPLLVVVYSETSPSSWHKFQCRWLPHTFCLLNIDESGRCLNPRWLTPSLSMVFHCLYTLPGLNVGVLLLSGYGKYMMVVCDHDAWHPSYQFSYVDFQNLLCCKTFCFNRLLGKMNVYICNIDKVDGSFLLDYVCGFLCLFDWYYASEDYRCWKRGLDFDVCKTDINCLVFLEWHNMKAFVFQPQNLVKFHSTL